MFRSDRLTRRSGVWYLRERPVRPGDWLEVRRAIVAGLPLGEGWTSAIVRADGASLRLVLAGAGAGGEGHVMTLESLSMSLAEIRPLPFRRV